MTPKSPKTTKQLLEYILSNLVVSYAHSLIIIDQATFNDLRRMAGYKTGLAEDGYGQLQEVDL